MQTTLLKLMEETEVPLRSPMDLQAQIQADHGDAARRDAPKRETINTRHILFIVSGAFDGSTEQREAPAAPGDDRFRRDPATERT